MKPLSYLVIPRALPTMTAPIGPFLTLFPGALYFYKVEEVLETQRYDAMKMQDSNISDSIGYSAQYLTDLHYNPVWTYNNCTR